MERCPALAVLPQLTDAVMPTLTIDRLAPQELPRHRTPLVGREREAATARALLLEPNVALLTLTGPGGVGKTRLALRVAADLAGDDADAPTAFPDGVCFVDLGAVADPALVLPAIAQALEVRETGGRPILAALTATLRPLRLLLVLDNVEQVAAAAPAIEDLLTACPGVKALATSRAVLRLSLEQEMAVPPLALPPLAPDHPPPNPVDLAQYDAVALFVQRARAVDPGFVLTADVAPAVAAICARLDGLPLAIELAAARIRLFPPQAMLARLEHRLPLLTSGPRNLPARQQTLRAAIAWGHDLLTPAEQALFRRLAVFAGSFTLSAAEFVGRGIEQSGNPDGEDLPTSSTPRFLDSSTSVLDGVSLLAEKSLLGRAEGPPEESRFGMLETIREYGLERLAASGEEEEVRQRHAAFFLDLAERASAALIGPEQGRWLDRLEAEHDNVRAALSWAISRAERGETALRLAAAMWQFWLVRGYLSEGRGWLERALSQSGAPSPLLRAKALMAAGALAELQGDSRAMTFLEEALALFRTAGNDAGAANALTILGGIALTNGDAASASDHMEAAAALIRRSGEPGKAAAALHNLGLVAMRQGDDLRAEPLLSESLSGFRESGNAWAVAVALVNLADLRQRRGDTAAGAELLGEALDIQLRQRSAWGVAACLVVLVRLSGTRSDPARVARQPLITEENLEQYLQPNMPPLHYALCGCENMPGFPERWGGKAE